MNLSASAPAQQRDEATIVVTFPDRSTRSFPRGVTGAEIAGAIGKSLAKAALVVIGFMRLHRESPAMAAALIGYAALFCLLAGLRIALAG